MKNCNIDLTRQAREETRQHCYTPMVRECGEGKGEGSEACRETFDTECISVYKPKIRENGSNLLLAKTECQRIPKTLCGARKCEIVAGPEECHNQTITTVSDVPEETCDLVPQKTCQHVYRLVPFLHPTKQCEDLPREVCSYGLQPPIPGDKPITTKWYFDPGERDSIQNSDTEKAQIGKSRKNINGIVCQ